MSLDNQNNCILNIIKEEKLDRLDLDDINISNSNEIGTNETVTNSNDAYDFNLNNDLNNKDLVEDMRSNEQVIIYVLII
jgi:hypothetical protein